MKWRIMSTVLWTWFLSLHLFVVACYYFVGIFGAVGTCTLQKGKGINWTACMYYEIEQHHTAL